MFGYVPHPSTFLHPLEKPAFRTDTAAVLVKCRKDLLQATIKASDLIGWSFLQFTNIQDHLDTGSDSPVIGSRERAYLTDFH